MLQLSPFCLGCAAMSIAAVKRETPQNDMVTRADLPGVAIRKSSLYDLRFTQHPFDAFTISRFRLLSCMQLETLNVEHVRDDLVLRPSFKSVKVC